MSLEKKNYDLVSSFVPWVFRQTEIFYYMIHPLIFINVNFDISSINNEL